jgi:capsular exopolysaccharide synthesis family protein
MNSFRDGQGRGAEGASTGSRIARKLIDDPTLVIKNRPDSPLAERYRRLRLQLEQGSPDSTIPRQLTVVTSAIPGEGKTTTAVNLALAYAEDRRLRTLLVDADLRRPSVSRFVVRKPTIGLSEVLAGGALLDDVLIELSDSRLWILPSGAPSAMPQALLQRKSFGALIAELRRRFDRIVIDTPPTVPFTDAAVLASHADGALIVVRAGRTTKTLVRRAKESLKGARGLGVVLNDVAFTVIDRYYSKYDEYRPDRYADARRGARA